MKQVVQYEREQKEYFQKIAFGRLQPDTEEETRQSLDDEWPSIHRHTTLSQLRREAEGATRAGKKDKTEAEINFEESLEKQFIKESHV